MALGVTQTAAASGIVLDRFLSLWLPLIVGVWALNEAKKRDELPNIFKKKKVKK